MSCITLSAYASVTTTGSVSPDPTTTSLSDDIHIGPSATGSVTVDGGDDVFSEDTRIGSSSSGFTGTLTVDGVGSTWTANHNLTLYLGAINIDNGAEINVGYSTELGALGNAPNNTTLNFNNGTLNTGTLIAAPRNITGTGIVNSNGLVSDFDIVFNTSNGLQQQIVLDDLLGQNVAVNLDLTNTGGLGIGHSNSGSLRIEEGVAIASNWAYLGYKTGSSATVTVDGVGSRWDITRSLRQEGQSNLDLRVINGGVIATGDSIYIGSSTTGGDGTSVLVSGAGSMVTGDGVFLGGWGDGQFVTKDGGAVSAVNLEAGGTSAAGAGSVLEGAGSKWSATTRFVSNGNVHARNMGQITTASASILIYDLGQSTIIDGEGTSLVASNILTIGSASSSGRLDVINGGYVEALDLDAGTHFSGSPAVELVASGTGSEIKVLDRLHVITGSLSATTGAKLVANLLDSEALTSVLFSGQGTSIESTIGARLSGNAQLTDSAAWTSDFVTVRDSLTISGSTTKLTTTGSDTGILLTGNGALVQQDNGLVSLASNLRVGKVVDEPFASTDSTDSDTAQPQQISIGPNFDDATYNLSGGSLDLNGNDIVLGSGPDIEFNFTGGEIRDVGTFAGTLQQDGGTLAPGNSPGITTITEDYNLNAGTIAIELAGLIRGTEHDVVVIDGTLNLGANSELDVMSIDGFLASDGDSFDIFDFASMSGTFDSINLPSLANGLAWDTSQLYNDGSISVLLEFIVGDMDGDGTLNNDDINSFVMALIDPSAYASTHNSLNPHDLGDFNNDGILDNLDIFGFVTALTGGEELSAEQATLFEQANLQYVPEPGSLAILTLAGLVFVSRRRR
ncbi:MAG: PEP-CTERM sorting domain-containing protein [Planctomycetota bacterium]